jgi:dolichol-phosphate mannosyltransferase
MEDLQTAAIQLNTVHLAIVCPMANESQSAVDFVRQVLTQCGQLKKVDFFVVLDNVSKDDTLDKLRSYSASEPRLKVVWAPENRCVVDAYQRGYREAIASGADWVLEIDAGFSHRPEDIPAFLNAMSKGSDCVFATRFALGGRIEGSSSRRKLVSKGGTILTNLVLHTELTDMTSGFQLFRRPILEKILAKGIFSRGPFFQTEMKAYCLNTQFTEVPIVYCMASHNLGAGSIKESLQQLRRLYTLKRAGALAL